MSDNTFTVEGPEGTTIEFPVGTTPDAVKAAFSKIGAQAAPAAEQPISVDNVVRAAARGVPGGGILPKFNAATAALVAPAIEPFMAKGPSSINDAPGETIPQRFRARYAKSLAMQEAMDKGFEEQHPVVNTAAELAGGFGSLGGAAKAIPGAATAMGMTGPLKQAVPLGATTGAAIGVVDAMSRDADIKASAELGALTGAGGVIGGKVAGKVWDMARGAFREAPVATPTRTLPVAGIDVPVRESVLSRDPVASQQEQGILHGSEGDLAQAEARGGMAATDAAMEQAHGKVATSMDPTGTGPATPMAAGEAVGSEVAAQEASRAAAEAQRLQGVANETNAIRGELNTSPTPGVIADTPRTAAEVVQQHLIRARDTVARARDRAYDLLRGTEGEFNPAGFQRISNRMRTELSGGSDPVKVSDTLTPHTAEALRDLETNVGQGRFENQAQTPMQMGPDGRPIARPITADTIDEARKRLISMQRTANDAARRTGDFTDVRGIRRVISAFDDHVIRVARTPGGFSGDPEQLIGRLGRARELHSGLKRTFGPSNPQDAAGKAIEKIVGKRGVEPADPQAVAQHLFGSATEAGGPQQAATVQRVIDLFGENSPQVAALKQGLLSHLADTPAGLEAMSREKVADRIHKFFTSGKGVTLSHTLYSPSERARLLAHANRMRSAADPKGTGRPLPGSTEPTVTDVDKIIARWSGRNGGERATPKQIVDDLIGNAGQKGNSPQLVAHLRDHLSPEALGKLKSGVWKRITESPEGTLPWKDQKIGNRIGNFLNGDGKGLADALYTKAELAAMKEIGDFHLANLPIEGTTNPSGSGHVVQRMARSAGHAMLPFIGLHAGGLPGVAAGFAANKGVTNVINRIAAKGARERFYGPQAKRAASQLPQTFGALGGMEAANQSR